MNRILMWIGGGIGYLVINTTIFLSLAFLYSQPASYDCHGPQMGTQYEVVVVNTDIPEGTILEAHHIEYRSVPEQFLPANPLLANEANIFLGQEVNTDIAQGSMVLTSDFYVIYQESSEGMRVLIHPAR